MSSKQQLIETLQKLPDNAEIGKNPVGNLLVWLIHPKTGDAYTYGWIDIDEDMKFFPFVTDATKWEDGTTLADLLAKDGDE